MYKIFLAMFIAIGVMSLPTAVEAKPTHHHKKHKYHKKAAVVKAEHNPFLHCEGCNNKPVVQVATISHEESNAEYFNADRLRTQLLTHPLQLTREEKRQSVVKECSWFVCPVNNPVVAEVKAWEGKSVKNNRKELKDLFADGKIPPIDPMRTPWCAAFANGILSRNGFESTKSLMARSFLTWGFKTKNPKEGDIVVLKRGKGSIYGHVGFFQGYEIIDGVTFVKVIGGNTDHAVQVGYYPVSKVLGFRTAVA